MRYPIYIYIYTYIPFKGLCRVPYSLIPCKTQGELVMTLRAWDLGQCAKRTREWKAARSKSTSAFHMPLLSFIGTLARQLLGFRVFGFGV